MFKRRKFELFETFGVPKREGVTSYNRINCLNFQYFFNLCFFSWSWLKHRDVQLVLIEAINYCIPSVRNQKLFCLPLPFPTPWCHGSAFVTSYPQGGFSPHTVLCALHEVCTDQKTVGLDPWRVLLIYPPQTHVFDPISFNSFFMLSHAWHTSR